MTSRIKPYDLHHNFLRLIARCAKKKAHGGARLFKNSLSHKEDMMELVIFIVCAMLMTAVAVKVR
ncbi:hypothetical protein [Pantoea sp.]|uniref:hypothetical protein n=1 Tax=Pantoea sp. TaxID=69393 RepID=UPI0028A8BAD9|nr:hypothetical protein [Pantoea sp.]